MTQRVARAGIVFALLFVLYQSAEGVGGRLLHSAVQIPMTNIRLRGLVFMINFLAVLGLWALVVESTSTGR